MRVGIGTATAPPVGTQSAHQNAISQQTVDSAPEKSGTPPMFISPVIHVDLSGLPITLFRDVDNGDVRFQIPSEEAVTKYRKADASDRLVEQVKENAAPTPKSDGDSAKQVLSDSKSLEQSLEQDAVDQ